MIVLSRRAKLGGTGQTASTVDRILLQDRPSPMAVHRADRLLRCWVRRCLPGEQVQDVYLSELVIKNFRQLGAMPRPFILTLQPGVTALVGENDCGKTAVIDAIRYALLTRDLGYIRVRPDDFHVDAASGEIATEITIRCKLSDLSDAERGAFVEYLTYESGTAELYVYWRAVRHDQLASRRTAEVSVRSGPEGTGPAIDLSPRQLLEAAYLRPLRDAEREMSPGQGSRLSQVLSSFPGVKTGERFDETDLPQDFLKAQTLSLAAMAEYFSYLVNQHAGISAAAQTINEEYLSGIALAGEKIRGSINFTYAVSESARLRHILERLELDLIDSDSGASRGRYGLGSNNLLYMACELLLLGKDPDGLPLLLVEEPEAHLHPQRQLRLMNFLKSVADADIPGSRSVQIILTTHSPNLSSKIPLRNLVLIEENAAFPLMPDATRLRAGDYRFLERFLDSTKANLFFARGLIIVEGDAEAILIPTLAKLIGYDLTAHGISIINVGHTGLRRYARIMQRAEGAEMQLSVPVACLADMDVMPDCAPQLLGYVENDQDQKWEESTRRWRALRDFRKGDLDLGAALESRRKNFQSGDGENVRTFVSDCWTFEYDLAFSGLAEEVFIAARLAGQDEALNDGRKNRSSVEAKAGEEFRELRDEVGDDLEKLSVRVYLNFATGKASKAIGAQYLAEILEFRARADESSSFKIELAHRLPKYIVDAIKYSARAEDTVRPSEAGRT